jgi:hypothetical protein
MPNMHPEADTTLGRRSEKMAMARCNLHKPAAPPRGKYGGPFYPVAVFNQAIICGLKICDKPAETVWLKPAEIGRYNNGERVFDFNTNSGAKVKVQ